MPARLWSRDLSERGLGLGSPSRWARAPESRAEGRRALQDSGFPFAQPAGEASVPVDREAGEWRAALVFVPLFFGWKGNDGRGQPSGAAVTSLLLPTCPALGLRASLRPRFSPPLASAMPLSLALCWALVPLALHPLCSLTLIPQEG